MSVEVLLLFIILQTKVQKLTVTYLASQSHTDSKLKFTELLLRTNENNFPGESLSKALGVHLGDSFHVCHLSCLIDTLLLYHHYSVQPCHFTPHD